MTFRSCICMVKHTAEMSTLSSWCTVLVNFMSLVGVCGNNLKGEHVSFGHTLRDLIDSRFPRFCCAWAIVRYRFVLEACYRAKQLMSWQVGSKEEEWETHLPVTASSSQFPLVDQCISRNSTKSSGPSLSTWAGEGHFIFTYNTLFLAYKSPWISHDVKCV